MRGDGLLRDVLEGKMWGKRRRGKPREGMIEDLKKELKQKLCEEMKRKDEDRELKDLKMEFGEKWF